MARLAKAEGLPPATGSALARITASQTLLSPEIAHASRPAVVAASPNPGELWRIGGDEALLVWVRRLLDGAVDVLPVVLDVDLADEHTLLLPASTTPLGLDLAIITSLRAHVAPDAFLSRVHDLGGQAAADIDEVMTAARNGRPPEGVVVGAPVWDADDQRIEYQRTVADVLADLGPAAWARRQKWKAAETTADPNLYLLVEEQLVLRHNRCTVHTSLRVVSALPSRALLSAVARIGYADTSLLLATLPDWSSQAPDDLAVACRHLVGQEPGTAAVAVCGAGPDYLTVVVDTRAMRQAYEPPTGYLAPPLNNLEPLQVVDALAKFLEQRDPAWEDVGGEIVVTATDLRATARDAADAAVADIAAQGRRAATPAKKEAWTAIPDGTADALADAVARLVAGEEPATVLDALTRKQDGT